MATSSNNTTKGVTAPTGRASASCPRRAGRNRHVQAELYRRVRYLHQAAHQDDLVGYLSDTGLNATENPKDPDLARAIVAEARRHGLGRFEPDAPSIVTLDQIHQAARWAAKREPSVAVAARFAVEHVVNEAMPTAAAMSGATPKTWRHGFPVGDRALFELPILRDALDGLSRQAEGVLKQARATGIVEATWDPGTTSLLFWGDAMRPPAEALALVATAVSPLLSGNNAKVLLVDGGHTCAAQVLSHLLDHAIVQQTGTAYGPWSSVASSAFNLVIISLPGEATRRFAVLVGAEFEDTTVRTQALRLLRDRGDKIDPEARLDEVLALAIPHIGQGTMVAIIGEVAPDRHHRTVRKLHEHLEFQPIETIDTSRRAVLVRYQEPPWAPMGVPHATDRLVSIWRVR